MKMPSYIEDAYHRLAGEVGILNTWEEAVVVDANDLRLILRFAKECLSTYPATPSPELCAMEALATLIYGQAGLDFLRSTVEQGGIDTVVSATGDIATKNRLPLLAEDTEELRKRFDRA